MRVVRKIARAVQREPHVSARGVHNQQDARRVLEGVWHTAQKIEDAEEKEEHSEANGGANGGGARRAEVEWQ